MIPKGKFIMHYSDNGDWNEISIMEKHGFAFARVYFFNDEPTNAYLDMLSVTGHARKKGLGTQLQEMREQIGKDKGCTFSWLWVEKNSWQHEWYKRRGYIDDDEKDEEHVWMKKSL